MQNFVEPTQYSIIDNRAVEEGMFFQKIYVWMCAGLALTAGVAYMLSTSDSWLRLLASNSLIFYGIFILEFVVVLVMSAAIDKLPSSALQTMFLFYAFLTGTTFSLLAIIYHPDTIFKAFISTSAVYGTMAIYGFSTKRNLMGWGRFLFMALIGLIIAGIVNLFMYSGMTDFIICIVGVIIFACITAYDHQKLRLIFANGFQDGEIESKFIIMGALALYLDFINMFLYLLRLFGSRK